MFLDIYTSYILHLFNRNAYKDAGLLILECPCSMTEPASRACPASTSAQWPICLDAPPSVRASSAETVNLRLHTASRTIGVLDASADTQRDRGNGSRLYNVNIWMWRYGRGRARMVSIAEEERIRRERLSESRIRPAETRKRHGGFKFFSESLNFNLRPA